MKKYKVDSLSKYLALIEENIISDFIYRGQSEPYFSIQASGFRPYCGGWDSDMIYDMPYLHTSFYNRVELAFPSSSPNLESGYEAG